MQKVEDLVEANLPELARITALELGHPMLTSFALSYLCANWFGYYAGLADKIEGRVVPMTPAHNAGFDYTLSEPYGVVGIILTWNGPMVSVGMKVAPALAAGNCVVVKTPELAPYTVARFVELALEAGLPPGVLHVLPGGPEAGDRLVRHPDVGKVSFTGGVPTAQKIIEASKETIKPLCLELGGKSANLVFPDADLPAAVSLSVQSCFTIARPGLRPGDQAVGPPGRLRRGDLDRQGQGRSPDPRRPVGRADHGRASREPACVRPYLGHPRAGTRRRHTHGCRRAWRPLQPG